MAPAMTTADRLAPKHSSRVAMPPPGWTPEVGRKWFLDDPRYTRLAPDARVFDLRQAVPYGADQAPPPLPEEYVPDAWATSTAGWTVDLVTTPYESMMVITDPAGQQVALAATRDRQMNAEGRASVVSPLLARLFDWRDRGDAREAWAFAVEVHGRGMMLDPARAAIDPSGSAADAWPPGTVDADVIIRLDLMRRRAALHDELLGLEWDGETRYL